VRSIFDAVFLAVLLLGAVVAGKRWGTGARAIDKYSVVEGATSAALGSHACVALSSTLART